MILFSVQLSVVPLAGNVGWCYCDEDLSQLLLTMQCCANQVCHVVSFYFLYRCRGSAAGFIQGPLYCFYLTAESCIWLVRNFICLIGCRLMD
jgi:hypothetical protein